jgi:microcystin-dependent protein
VTLPLSNWHANNNGTPRANATVTYKAASLAEPNPNPVLGTTLTNSSGRWSFNVDETAGPYDVYLTDSDGTTVIFWKGLAKLPHSFGDLQVATDAAIQLTKLIGGTIDDTATPGAVAASLAVRLNQFANLFKQIVGHAAWHTAPGGRIVPVGTLLPYLGGDVPDGYLLAYGQTVSRATYAALFAKLGTQHGSGDGTTTFNLPDTRGRTIIGQDDLGGVPANRIPTATARGATGGAATVTLTTATIPAHAHTQQGAIASGTTSASHTHGATGLTFAGAALAGHAHTAASNGDHTHSTYTGSVNQGTSGVFYSVTNGAASGTPNSGAVITSGAHTHSTDSVGAGTPGGTLGGSTATPSADHTHTTTLSGATATTGGDGAHANDQPWLAASAIIAY